MAYFAENPENGGVQICYAFQIRGSAGPHWTFWGRDTCLHLYVDMDSPAIFDEASAKAMAEHLEATVPVPDYLAHQLPYNPSLAPRYYYRREHDGRGWSVIDSHGKTFGTDVVATGMDRLVAGALTWYLNGDVRAGDARAAVVGLVRSAYEGSGEG